MAVPTLGVISAGDLLDDGHARGRREPFSLAGPMEVDARLEGGPIEKRVHRQHRGYDAQKKNEGRPEAVRRSPCRPSPMPRPTKAAK